MHNDRMRLPARLLPLFLAATLTLAGCSGSEETPEGAPSASPTESATAEPYLAVPDDVTLTEQGSALVVGNTATVAFEPRQGEVAALDIKVTSLEKASFDQFVGWELTKEIKSTAPYFVRATVTNVGDTELGGKKKSNPPPVPLYAVDGENRLIESSLFTGSFKPCEGASLPKNFKTGDKLKACMVYLAPGKGELAAVSFRPTQEFNPIIWEGEVEPAAGSKGADKKSDKKSDKKKKSGGKNDN